MCTFVHVVLAAMFVLLADGLEQPGARSAAAGEVDPKDVAGPRVIARTNPGTSWVAFAVSSNGRVFKSESFNSEESARTAARNECEHTSGRTCRDTISVPDFWAVSVLRCGSQNFLGASAQGVAYAIALDKAAAKGVSADLCQQVATY